MLASKTFRTLYFFSHSFPFNKQGETYVKNEFNYLAEKFDRIFIIPLVSSSGNNTVSKLPINCIVMKPLIKNKIHHYFIGLIGFRSLNLYLKDFFLHKVYLSKKKFIYFVSDFCTTNIILKSKIYRQIIRNATKEDIFYFYWGKGCVNSLPFLNNIKFKTIARFHGGDLYDYNYDGYIPIQKTILNNLDLVCFISKNGSDYLKSKNLNLAYKSFVSYLGTEDQGLSIKSTDGVLRILSCSNVVPEKRVDLILEAILLLTESKVEWTHIGEGSDFEYLKSKVKFHKSNVKVNLLGRLSNDEVFFFYRNNPVDVFVNVSKTEGLPVSIMEAISFDIPIIATNVGGTSEIVNNTSGILLSSNPTATDLCQALINFRLMKFSPRELWLERFTAKKNYTEFISILQNL